MKKTWALIAAINAVVLYNALVHDTDAGYDAKDHLDYAVCLSEGRLPGPECSAEYYSPPLPYVPAALWHRVARGREATARAGLVANVGWSLAICWLVVALCRLRFPAGSPQELWSLALLGCLPVYYRTLAMLRGEPALAAMLLAAAYLVERKKPPLWSGAVFGLALLCRQWAVFALPALAWGAKKTRAAGLFLAAAVLVGGWFYASLRARYGSAAQWARQPEPPQTAASVAKRLLGFDIGAIIDPLGCYRVNEVWPVLYADTWTDAQGYFLIYGVDEAGRHVYGSDLIRSEDWLRAGNYQALRPWLALALLLALGPTLAMAWGLWEGFVDRRLAALVAASTLLGLVAWLEIFSPSRGHVIKASYVLQAFPFLALLGGEAAARWPKGARRGLAACCAALFLLSFTRHPSSHGRHSQPLYTPAGSSLQ